MCTFPIPWVRGRIAEHFVEERGEDAGGFGVGLGTLLAQRIRLVDYLHNPPLLRVRRKGDVVLPKLAHYKPGHFYSGNCGIYECK